MRFLLHLTAAALLVAIGIGGMTAAAAADRDARAADDGPPEDPRGIVRGLGKRLSDADGPVPHLAPCQGSAHRRRPPRVGADARSHCRATGKARSDDHGSAWQSCGPSRLPAEQRIRDGFALEIRGAHARRNRSSASRRRRRPSPERARRGRDPAGIGKPPCISTATIRKAASAIRRMIRRTASLAQPRSLLVR